ncbi:MAG: peptidase M28 [Sphingomonadales bacterium 32-65-25]|nr:MAG: peptidase M28 [Sphingomonadales bacterium 12-62-5]OYX77199.1 MAG: peptidase M28 [Sphingomonadales bacterium 32-65-25]
MRFILPLALLLTAAAPAPAIDVAQMKRDVETLASNAFEGRAPTTPGEAKTIAYLAQRMAAIGLKPGYNGIWLQPVPLVSITTDPAAQLRVAGGKEPIALAMNSDVAVATRLPQSQVSVNASDIVFVGHGIVAPERGWNDYAGVDVRGKTVLVLVNDPDWRTPAMGEAAGPFNGRAITYYGRYTYKYEEALRQGAAAALVIHDDEPAGYPWGVIGTSVGRPSLGLDQGSAAQPVLQVQGWITRAAAARVLASAGHDLARLEQAASRPDFRAITTGLKASLTLENKVERSVSHNVVGLLPGKTRPDEVVLVTAHWDHVGRCKADASGDDICNGALDNASGTAGVLALAGHFARAPRTERSLLFMAVTLEEAGLFGSAWYADHPIFPLSKTVGGVNMDVLSMNGALDGFTITGAGQSELEALATRLAAAQGRRLVPEASPEKGRYFRSDHFSLARQGVPMLMAIGGGELIGKPPGAVQVAANDFVDNRYHQPSDEYDPNWDWGGAVQDLTLFADFARTLANGRDWPNWLPDSEFRTIRDQSRAGVK